MFSILYPNSTCPSDVSVKLSALKEAFEILDCGALVGKKIADYFTDDPETLKNRHELFQALIRLASMRNDLLEIGEALSQFYETLSYMKQISAADESTESTLRSILSAQTYIQFIRRLTETLEKHMGEDTPSALIHLYEALRSDMQSEDFIRFEKELDRFHNVLDNIKSITVGVNLDAQLRPKEAGLIAFSDQVYKSGNAIDRFLRLDFKRDEYCCIAPLTATTRQMAYTERFQVDNAVNQAFEKVLKYTSSYSISHTVRIIEERMKPYVGLVDEFRALHPILRYITNAQNAGLPLCMATILPHSAKEALCLEGFYDPRLCGKGGRVVLNDLKIDKDQKIVILTGSNSGGKTVVLRSVAIIQLFALLGIPVPAQKAEVTDSAGVYVAFAPDNALFGNGRLEQECASLGKIYNACGQTDFVFLDEPFSTTSAEDAIELLEDYSQKVTAKDSVRIVITTHFHRFAREMQTAPNVLCCSLGTDAEKYALHPDSVVSASFAKKISSKFW